MLWLLGLALLVFSGGGGGGPTPDRAKKIKASTFFNPDVGPGPDQQGVFLESGARLFFGWGGKWYLVQVGTEGPAAPRFCTEHNGMQVCLVARSGSYFWDFA